MQAVALQIKPLAHHVSTTYVCVPVSLGANVSQTSCSQHRQSPSVWYTTHGLANCTDDSLAVILHGILLGYIFLPSFSHH
jgi:hypothetical protein